MKKRILLFLAFMLPFITLAESNSLYQEGLQAQREKRFEDAAQIYKQVVKENPQFAEGWWHLAQVYGSLNKPEEGLAALERAIKLDPDNVEYLAYYARFANWIGHYQKAKKAYLKIMQLQPGNFQAKAALAEMRGWVRNTSDTTNVPVAGLQAERENKWAKALEIYQGILQKNPDDGDLWLRVADIEYNRGQVEPALKAQEKASHFFPHDPEVFERLANLYLLSHQPEKALKALEYNISLEPANEGFKKTYQIYQNLALIPPSILDATQGFRWEKAIQGYEAYLKEHPKNAKLWIGLANIQSALGQFENAIISFNQASQAEPNRWDIHYFLAEMYRITGKQEDAWREINLALQSNPYRIKLLQSYMVIAKLTDHPNEAAEALQRIQRLNPKFKE